MLPLADGLDSRISTASLGIVQCLVERDRVKSDHEETDIVQKEVYWSSFGPEILERVAVSESGAFLA